MFSSSVGKTCFKSQYLRIPYQNNVLWLLMDPLHEFVFSWLYCIAPCHGRHAHIVFYLTDETRSVVWTHTHLSSIREMYVTMFIGICIICTGTRSLHKGGWATSTEYLINIYRCTGSKSKPMYRVKAYAPRITYLAVPAMTVYRYVWNISLRVSYAVGCRRCDDMGHR